MAGITPNRPGSSLLISQTGSPAVNFAVFRQHIIGAAYVDATTSRLYLPGGIQPVISATAQQVLDAIDPAPPVVTPPVAPPADLTQGKMRISPDGAARAERLAPLNPRGDWIVYHVSSYEITWLFTTDVDNPEIQLWPYLRS